MEQIVCQFHMMGVAIWVFSGELFRLKVYKMIQLRFLAMFAGLFIRGSVGCQRRY